MGKDYLSPNRKKKKEERSEVDRAVMRRDMGEERIANNLSNPQMASAIKKTTRSR